jgi:DNA modification methylase
MGRLLLNRKESDMDLEHAQFEISSVVEGANARSNCYVHCDPEFLLKQIPEGAAKLYLLDPPYDEYEEYFALIRERMQIEEANAIVFYHQEGHLAGADEYHHWIKPLSTKNFSRRCGRFIEHIAIFRNNPTFNQLHWQQMCGVHNDSYIMKPAHPHEKPITLLEKLILMYSNKMDLIVDISAGLGSSVFAARRTARKIVASVSDQQMFEEGNTILNG